MSQEQLKPCPFCGGRAEFNEHTPECYFTKLDAVKKAPKGDVACMVDLIPAWNTRATQPEQAKGGERVFLVATGEVYEGQETYTRHDIRPPMCDAEVLYTHPAPAASVSVSVSDEQIAACVKRASTYGAPFVGLLNPGGTPSDFSKRLTAEILALRPAQAGVPDDIVKDAQRYRWLRSYDKHDEDIAICRWADTGWTGEWVVEHDPDAAIDAAIRARSKT